MGMFDEMAGFTEAGEEITLSRRPLVLAEMLAKSTTKATFEYGKKPKEASPSPNTRFRPTPKPKFGAGKLAKTADESKTGTPASGKQTVPVRPDK